MSTSLSVSSTNIVEHHVWVPCAKEALQILLAWRCWGLPQQETTRPRAPPAPGEQPRAWCLQARLGTGGQPRSPPATRAAGGEPPLCCGGISFLCKYSNGISLKVRFEQHFCVHMRGNTGNPPAPFSGIALAHLGNSNALGCEVTGEG